MKTIRIVLLTDNLTRDYLPMTYVKEALEHISGVDVYIVGSVAEIQRMYYYLHKIQPHIVFVSQLIEKCYRDIAMYVRASDGYVIVLPAEITYPTKNKLTILNKNLTYNELFDLYLVPGNQMRKDILTFRIPSEKIIIVGAPKMDYIVRKWRTFLSRKELLTKYHIRPGRKNVFVFSTFIKTPETYILKDTAYIGTENEFIKLSRNIDAMALAYRDAIISLCRKYSEYNFIVKPHPLEKERWYESITEPNFFIVPNEYIVNILKSVDVAIHWYSTAAIECWIKGIKTIQYAPLKEFMPLMGEFHFGNPVAYSYNRLERAVGLYIDHPIEPKYRNFQKRYISLWFGTLDGLCGQRIQSVIEHAIRHHSFAGTKYERIHHWGVYVLLLLEELFGTAVSRKIASLVYPYHWKYAWKNAILHCPKKNQKKYV